MPKYFTETLIVAGPHLRDVFNDLKIHMEKSPPGELEISRNSTKKIIIRSFNPFTAILSYLYDVLRKEYPRNEFILTSGKEDEPARIAGTRKGIALFETYFDFASARLPRSAAYHQDWVTSMLRS